MNSSPHSSFRGFLDNQDAADRRARRLHRAETIFYLLATVAVFFLAGLFLGALAVRFPL